MPGGGKRRTAPITADTTSIGAATLHQPLCRIVAINRERQEDRGRSDQNDRGDRFEPSIERETDQLDGAIGQQMFREAGVEVVGIGAKRDVAKRDVAADIKLGLQNAVAHVNGMK
jgi:hypothetical protein